eukprot:6038915-Alexandrium_andersonii.AAC.1
MPERDARINRHSITQTLPRRHRAAPSAKMKRPCKPCKDCRADTRRPRAGLHAAVPAVLGPA